MLISNLENKLKLTKKAAQDLAQFSSEQKNKILLALAEDLQKNKNKILAANKKDILAANKKGLNKAFIDRLTITDKIFAQIISQVKNIAKLSDPIGEIIEEKKMPNQLLVQKIRVPLGVLGVIYESRPNVTIDAAALALKSGNAIVLKGGSDAIKSNQALAKIITQTLSRFKIRREAVLFLDISGREIVKEILKADKFIDVIIPRGGYDLVRKVVHDSKIPVLYHAEGGARIYIDDSADLKKALDICVNAKVSRPATCNSLDTIVVNQKIAKEFLAKFLARLEEFKVEIRADEPAFKILKNIKTNLKIKKASITDFSQEFLSLILAVKIVKSSEEAIKFIQKYSKKHSEGIIAENKEVYKKFVHSIDAAALFINTSTRFNDGGEFGLGAEMGVATGKLHARGPVGLRELTTYKWIIFSDGKIRN